LKDAKRLEIAARGITLMECGECTEDAVSAVAKAADGWYVVKYYRSPRERVTVADVPVIQSLGEASKKRGRDPQKLEVSMFYYVGWIAAMIMHEAITLAAEEVGPENLSGRAIRDGLASIKDLDVGGLMAPVTLSDAKPYCAESAFLYRVEGGEFHLLQSAIPIPDTWVSTWLKR